MEHVSDTGVGVSTFVSPAVKRSRDPGSITPLSRIDKYLIIVKSEAVYDVRGVEEDV